MAEASPEVTIKKLLTGFWLSQGIYVAAKLGLADLLASGSRSVEDLARATSTHTESLYRLMRMLASIGVFREEGERRFALTPLAECLREGVPGSQRAVALMMGEEHYQSWGKLLHSIQTGECAFEHLYGENIFDYMSQHPEMARIFDAAMTGIHGHETLAMLVAYDFSDINTLADVGGGNGSLLLRVLEKYPQMQGMLVDLPTVVERARPNLAAAGVNDRCRAIGASFFESIPTGADAYLFRHIIHDWDDARATTILTNCRRAVPATGRLLLVETVIPPGNEPCFGKLLDVNMLVVPGGTEHTEQQYRELFHSAGFELVRIVPTRAGVDVIEGKPI